MKNNKLDVFMFCMSFVYAFWSVYILIKYSVFLKTYELDTAYIAVIYGFISYLLLRFGKKGEVAKKPSNFVNFMRGGFVGYWILILYLVFKHKDFNGLDLKFGYALSYTAVYEVFQIWWVIVIMGVIGIVFTKRNSKKKQIQKPIVKTTPPKATTELKAQTKPIEKKPKEEPNRNYNNDLF